LPKAAMVARTRGRVRWVQEECEEYGVCDGIEVFAGSRGARQKWCCRATMRAAPPELSLTTGGQSERQMIIGWVKQIHG
jgi:hypothetical protein